MNLDELVCQIVSDAQTANGENHRVPPCARSQPLTNPKRPKFRTWTAEEDAFYLAHAGSMSYEEMAGRLGRTRNAIKIRFTRKGFPAPSKVAGYLTAQKVAVLLSIDPHKTVRWIDLGILPGERMFFANRAIRRISLLRLKMWLVRPESWIYFDAGKIKNLSLRSLVLRAQSRWGDEWWTTRQAADYLGIVDEKDVLRQIQLGKIRGIQAVHKGGRNKAGWSYWYVRRSEAIALTILKGRDAMRRIYPWPAGADAFLLRARAKGLAWDVIARMMKWSPHRCSYRYHCLKLKRLEVS